jgi:hypothetical protein
MQKRLSEITREEWMEREWYDASGGGEQADPIYVSGVKRDPDEREAAGREFDRLTRRR